MSASPHQVLEAFRRAAVDRSLDDMAALYADDAVYEFPFTGPGVPSRMEGRDAIVGFVAETWRDRSFVYDRYRVIDVHDTSDPGMLVVEQVAIGRGPSGDPFELPQLMVLTVRDGRIVHLRDYVNLVAVAEALDVSRG